MTSDSDSGDYYAKHFIPLESDPDIFNELLHSLGVSKKLSFQEIFSLDEPELLPHPAVAVIVLFSADDSYDPNINHPCSSVAHTDQKTQDGEAGDASDIVWFKQTIQNACGFYALLHAVANCHVENAFEPGSTIAQILADSKGLPPLNRSSVLEKSDALEAAYSQVAQRGQTSAPESPEDEVEFHYICVAKSQADGRLFALDGDMEGPVATGVQLGTGDKGEGSEEEEQEEDLLSERCVRYFRDLISGVIAKQGDSVNFNLMALVVGDD